MENEFGERLTERDLFANDVLSCCADLADTFCGDNSCVTCITDKLMKLGYRKVSDVAREIFAEIEETVKKAIRVCDRYAVIPMLREAKMSCYKDLLGYIEKLKKKYGSEGGE